MSCDTIFSVRNKKNDMDFTYGDYFQKNKTFT